ncbi:MAG: hypothetical protein R3E89_15510 [Thiolinea sp.]
MLIILFRSAGVPTITRISFLVSALVMAGGAYLAMQLVLENKELGFTAPPLSFPIWIAQLALPVWFCFGGPALLTFGVHPELASGGGLMIGLGLLLLVLGAARLAPAVDDYPRPDRRLYPLVLG